MKAESESSEEAALQLTAIAELHLKHIHPEVQKTHEEVNADIRAHMVSH